MNIAYDRCGESGNCSLNFSNSTAAATKLVAVISPAALSYRARSNWSNFLYRGAGSCQLHVAADAGAATAASSVSVRIRRLVIVTEIEPLRGTVPVAR